MFDPQHSSVSVTNAPSGTTKTNAWFVEERGSQMLSIALSVRDWRRIEMGVRRLLIWGPVGRICFSRRRDRGGAMVVLGVEGDEVDVGTNVEMELQRLLERMASRCLPMVKEALRRSWRRVVRCWLM